MGLGISDRQQPDDFAAWRDQRRAGEEADIDLPQIVALAVEPGVGLDILDEQGLARAHHVVGETADTRILASFDADPRLVPEPVGVDENDGRPRRPEHERGRPRDPVEPAVGSTVERMQRLQRSQSRGFAVHFRP